MKQVLKDYFKRVYEEEVDLFKIYIEAIKSGYEEFIVHGFYMFSKFKNIFKIVGLWFIIFNIFAYLFAVTIMTIPFAFITLVIVPVGSLNLNLPKPKVYNLHGKFKNFIAKYVYNLD